MKSIIVATAAFLALSVPAFAQAPSNNASVSGTETTSGNGAGAPSAATPAGQIATTGGVVPASPPAVPSVAPSPLLAAPAATADSKVTGTTAAPVK